MDRRTWWAAVPGVAKSWTQLSMNIQNRHTDIENRLGIAKEKRERRGMDWEFGVSRCKLLHLAWISNKVQFYNTGNYIQYPVINHNSKEYEKEYIHVCVTESLSYAEINKIL